MTPEDLGDALGKHLGGGVSVDASFALLTADVPREQWVAAAEAVRDDPQIGCRWFDFLTAYDELAEGFSVVVHAWSLTHRHHVVLRTRVPRDDARLPTLTGVWRGANWHERETFEMFGVVFDGHPNLVPLLLPDGFEGNPLRKEFVLASRVVKEWPGAKEPGESHSDAPARRRMRPPGVPEPDEWGPEAVTRAQPASETDPPERSTPAPSEETP